MKGFTLIETMVAIAILTLAIAGPLFTASRAIVAAQVARDQLTANYLAQEGIEHLRALRDREFLAAYAGGGDVSDLAWANFVTSMEASCLSSSKTCTLDPLRSMGYTSGFSIEPCSGSCTPLYRRSDGVYTQQNSGDRTIFTRTIQVSNVSGTDERIESKVSWLSRGTTYSVTVNSHLTPWQ